MKTFLTMGVAAWVLVFGSLMAPALSAHADDGLPSDLGPISIESSRRELQARIQDWSDDRADIQPRRVLACALAGMEGAWVSQASGGLLAPLLVIRDLPGLLGKKGDLPSAPLDTPLAELASKVKLTAEEAKQVARLRARDITDTSDKIRLFIDTQTLLMRVSGRLYQDQIDFHVSRAQGVAGFFRSDDEYCKAHGLRVDRDAQMIRAANRVLTYYDFLEQELAD
jgi:hypothetical protein